MSFVLINTKYGLKSIFMAIAMVKLEFIKISQKLIAKSLKLKAFSELTNNTQL